MNRQNRLCRSLAAMILLCTAVCGATVGCQSPEPQPGVVETETLPDLTDHRTPTSTVPYQDRMEGSFAGATPTDPADFSYEIEADGVTVTGYTGHSSVVVIPASIDGHPVVAIADGAFDPDRKADKETDADTEAETNTDAASNTESTVKSATETTDDGSLISPEDKPAELTALYIPDTVTHIGRGAFKGCTSLATLRTPVVVAPGTTVDENGEMSYFFGALFGADNYYGNALSVPRSLTTLIVGEGTETIPAYAFYACRNLVAVGLPSTLKRVEAFAFYDCEALAYADLSETSLTSVGTCAFAECESLLRFDLPATVTSVGQGAVKGCADLEDMTLPFIGGTPTEHTYLGYVFGATDYTFAEGHLPISLMHVTLLSTGYDLPDNAFFGCSYLRSVTISEGVGTIGHRAFYGCARLMEVILPDTVTAIGNEAFAGCIRLQTVDLGLGVTTLGVQTFMRCLTLREITLPEGVTALPASCFAGCMSLQTVTAPGITSADHIGHQAYRGCSSLVTAPYMAAETETAAVE